MERWRDIPGFGGDYQVSEEGKIRSFKRCYTGRVLKQYVNAHNGYCYVCLCKNGESRQYRVHCLVAETFLGRRKGEEQVNHKDGNKTNNAVSNLEYCTQSENMKHAYATGLEKRTGLKVIRLDDLKVYETATDAARDVSGGRAQGEMVARVCRGERSHYRGRRYAFYADYLNGAIPPFRGRFTKKASATLWA